MPIASSDQMPAGFLQPTDTTDNFVNFGPWCMYAASAVTAAIGLIASLLCKDVLLVFRANNYGHEARAVSPADSQVEDIKDDLDRSRTRVRDQAEGTFQEGKEKSQNWWNKLFGAPHCPCQTCLLLFQVNDILAHAPWPASVAFPCCMDLDSAP